MVKSVQARRKAQQLARDGQIQSAVEEMRRLLLEAEADPYDHVYLGDLLIRLGQSTEAVDAWILAVRSYEQAGLNRNAIAICKKVLRLDPRRVPVQRTLGDLYVAEGLWGEAVPHFLAYLDGIGGDERFGPAFLETLERAASVVGLQVEAALRLADHYLRVHRGDRAAELLLQIADRIEQSGGGEELAAELRRRAAEASAESGEEAAPGEATAPTAVWDLDSAETGSGSTGSSAETSRERDPAESPLTFGADFSFAEVETPASDAVPARSEAGPPAEPPTAVVDEFSFDLPARSPALGGAARQTNATAEDRDATGSQAEAAPAPREFIVEHLHGPGESGSAELEWKVPESEEGVEPALPASEPAEGAEDGRVWDLDEGGNGLLDWAADPEPVASPDATAIPAPPEPDPLDPTPEPHGLLARAEEAFARKDWRDAQRLFERVQADHPLDPHVLGRLVEVARALRDPALEIHYLTLFGDAWIDSGEMERALEVFVQVQRLDPENTTARRRLARFQEMGIKGADTIPQPPASSVTEVIETGAAQVTVGPPSVSVGEKEWVDLGALLEAFQDGLKNQIADDDHQSHYDLAVSHRTMGLLKEAIDEADAALAVAGIPDEIECRTRELKGQCLVELDRHREAVHEFRAALDRPLEDAERRRSLQYSLAVALESAREWHEAAEIYESILSGDVEYRDAVERRERCLHAWVTDPPASTGTCPDSGDGMSGIAEEAA